MNNRLRGKPRHVLFDMDIDEISVVDRPANKDSAIVFAKAAQEEDMDDDLFYEDGSPISGELDFGDVVYDSEGNEYEVVPDDFEPDYIDDFEPDYEAVGKAYDVGDEVYEVLSKAADDGVRDSVMSDAITEIELAKAAAEEAHQELDLIRDQQAEAVFISKAASYNIPVDEVELGLILKAAATVLTDDQLDLLDGILENFGDILFDEYGYEGGSEVTSYDLVGEMADEIVEKADASHAEAVTALYEMNPEAYEEYLREAGM